MVMTVMDEKIVIEFDGVPKGSLLEKYVNVFSDAVKNDATNFVPRMKKVFVECWRFFTQKEDITCLPQILLKLVSSHDEFMKAEQRESKKAISKEDAKLQAHAFSVGNRFQVRIYVDLEFLIGLLKYGYPTFVLNLVTIYVHEMLHTAFPQKYEQEIHDLECSLVESFLGFEVPKEFKNLRASDYYNNNQCNNGIS
jgi:hypothetical protein